MDNLKKKLFEYFLLIIAGNALLAAGIIFFGGQKDAWEDTAEGILFSCESGFYSDDFDLTIQAAKGSEIYYTVDGSVPTAESIHYTGPIHLSDASGNENVYCIREDVSSIFSEAAPQEAGEYYRGIYKNPDMKVDKCNCIRAIAIDAEGRSTDVKTGIYFVGFDEKTGLDSVKIISIVTDPDNLFGYESGMYVTGKAMDDYVCTLKAEGSELEDDFLWMYCPANYMYGYHEEAEVNCQFFENGELVLSQNCGMKIHGGSGSRILPQKSLNLYARKEYGEGRFQYNLFENSYYPKRVALFSGSSDEFGKITDWITSKLCEGLNVGTLKFEPYVLFLNGEYWGFYWLTEKYDEEYLEYYYNADPDNVILIKNSALKRGNEEDYKLYEDFAGYIIENDMSTPEAYEWFLSQADIDSFLDYYAALIYVARQLDWPENNVALWRTRVSTGGKYNDSKWRWLIFDVNNVAYSEKELIAGQDSFDNNIGTDEIFSSLMENDMLRNQLLDRILEMEHSVYDSKYVSEKMELFHSIMDEPMKNHSKRYWADDGYERFMQQVDQVENFLYARHDSLMEMIEKHR